MFGRKKIALDSELALCYYDQKDYCLACIHNSYDVSELEAQRFLEGVEKVIVTFVEKYSTSNDEYENVLVSIKEDMAMNDQERRSSLIRSLEGELPALSMINEITLTDPKYTNHFKKLRLQMEKFTQDWNANTENRDKSMQVIA